MISVRNVHKRFGPQVVLDNVSIEIEPGKTTAVVGPSGVGKSVLLKLIMGILSPDSGEIYIGGENITAATISSGLNVTFSHPTAKGVLTWNGSIA